MQISNSSMSLVTLITDFGYKDYYTALLKAALYTYQPELTIVDISHDITRHDIMEASFFLKCTYNNFPKGSIHVVLVNSFYDDHSEVVVFEHNGHKFIGPNNGLFSLVFPELNKEEVHKLNGEVDTSNQYELIGAAVKDLAKNAPLNDFAIHAAHFDQKIALQPVVTSSQIRATIVHVDQFGNVIVNINRSTFEQIRKGRPFAIYYKSNEPIERLAESYSDCPIGDVCAFFNTVEFLEIAVNMGNAHELLNLNKNETIQINFF